MVEPVRDPLAFLDEPEAAPGRPANAPEVLLVGTGARQRFLRPEVLRPLLAIGVGVEVMDTHAASRTYNILMAEGRRVVVALIPRTEIPRMTPSIGKPAPLFTAESTIGPISLEQCQGRAVVLYFYPKDNTLAAPLKARISATCTPSSCRPARSWSASRAIR